MINCLRFVPHQQTNEAFNEMETTIGRRWNKRPIELQLWDDIVLQRAVVKAVICHPLVSARTRSIAHSYAAAIIGILLSLLWN